MAKVLLINCVFYVSVANAGLVQLFKDENGKTNWQHVANWSSGILILLLSITVITLYFIHRRARRANKALKEIQGVLEQRVQERTATLDESNRLLTESNRLLLDEMSEHKATTGRLRSSEAYIKNILESMPSMLIGLNKDLIVTQWNKTAEKITGVATTRAIGQNLWEVYPTITVSPKQVSNVLEKNSPITIKHSQRGQYYFDITVYPLHEQIETGLVIMIDDVTQRILAENMLIQRDKMSSMGEFASSMAHDINVPVQALLQDLQAVRKTAKTMENADRHLIHLLDDAVDRGKQASGVIKNLLAFSNSQGGEKTLCSLPDIASHAVGLAADVLSDPSGLRFRDIEIETHYQPDLPQIPCYAPELQQVFLSLFRHACHALGQTNRPGFEPKIVIEMSESYDALWIKIHHNGLGLTGEEQQFIFEPFFNTDQQEAVSYDAAKRLSFSYFIITEHHRGQMAVTADPEIGTTFHIQLSLH